MKVYSKGTISVLLYIQLPGIMFLLYYVMAYLLIVLLHKIDLDTLPTRRCFVLNLS